MSRSMFVLFAFALAALGFAAAGYGVVLVRRAVRLGRASLSWPQASGKITGTSIQERRMANPSDGPDTMMYEPLVAYAYTVEGRSLAGRRIAFRNLESGSREAAEAILGKYRVGARVDVRYDPDEPGTSVLEPGAAGIAGSHWWVGLIAAVSAIVAGFGVWGALR